MGGAVSSGRNNNELVDNLMEGNYIRSPEVERVFRALDRGDYMLPNDRDRAYKDLAWRNGHLHLSSPCIYSEVMEALEVKPGQSFLNIGSGTGYLSTMVGLLLGSGGISHGVEIHPKVVDHAMLMQRKFIESSAVIDDFDFCETKYYQGNGLCLPPLQAGYDRVYCGAACPEEYDTYFRNLIRIGGILVMPLNDTLLQVRRLDTCLWATRSLLNVSFAPLQLPPADTRGALVTPDNSNQSLKLDEQAPPALQVLSRGAIRRALLCGVLRRHPELRESPRAAPGVARHARPTRCARRCPRRICIPIDEAAGNFNMLHDLDREDGANEMNALLSLVLSMGENRVAGALRFDPSSDSAPDASLDDYSSDPDSEATPADPDDSDSSSPDPDKPNTDNPYKSQGTIDVVFRNTLSDVGEAHRDNDTVSPRSLTFEFHDGQAGGAAAAAVAARDPALSTSTGCEVPADVDVYLDNTDEPQGTSKTEMMWEESKTEGKREPSSDDDTESVSKGNEEKRQKLDSGIGEGNSPSSSSQEKTEKSVESETCDGSESGSHSEDTEAPITEGRRRQKRLRTLTPSSSTEEEWSECEGELRRRRPRRACDAGGDVRRVRRARLVRQALADLPLPAPLKIYVNWGRSPAA